MTPLLFASLLSLASPSGRTALPPGLSGTVSVDTRAGAVNSVRAGEALGAGVDGLERGDVARVYTPSNIRAMRSAGLRPLAYRLRTELGVETWHWNPAGGWSDPIHKQGYWTSASRPGAPIFLSNGYRLPRRGSTVDQAGDNGYSRVDDGDSSTFWKSNPYLDTHFTHEANALHPQWLVVDLGRKQPVDTIRIQWGVPFASDFRVEFWDGEESPLYEGISSTYRRGAWRAFPRGAGRHGGGDQTLRLADPPVAARLVRVWMTRSSGRAATGSRDIRDHLGFAVREISIGWTDAGGTFHDEVVHGASNLRQSAVTVSSTDPWHRALDRDPDVEQPGFDRVFHSGLTRGQPVLLPVGVLYDTPENAMNEIRWLRARGYPVREVEIGEEPDGQFVTPEDYGALFIQWARALHRFDPRLKLGGPGYQTDVNVWPAWPDAREDRSWTHRFIRYLKAHGHLGALAFFSFEWYPFDNVCADAAPQLAEEPFLLRRVMQSFLRDGVPSGVPRVITEYGYSAFAGQAEVDMPGALLNADIVGQFLTLGGRRAYLYGYEPNTLMRELRQCNTWGNLALFLSDDDRQSLRPLATWHAARLITGVWLRGPFERYALYPATSDLKRGPGQPLVTAYAARTRTGIWSLMLVNKDPYRAARVRLRLLKPHATRRLLGGAADLFQFSGAQYHWHADGEHGYPERSQPPVHTVLRDADTVTLPPYSLTVVRGRSSSHRAGASPPGNHRVSSSEAPQAPPVRASAGWRRSCSADRSSRCHRTARSRC